MSSNQDFATNLIRRGGRTSQAEVSPLSARKSHSQLNPPKYTSSYSVHQLKSKALGATILGFHKCQPARKIGARVYPKGALFHQILSALSSSICHIQMNWPISQ